jgi:hypothetical protein
MPILHTVKAGECIASIAFDHGHLPETIWTNSANAELKDQRQDPNVLLPGDSVTIPDKQVSELSKPDRARHRFRRKSVPEVLKLQLLIAGKPVAGKDYVLDLDGQALSGTTGSDGRIELPIPPNAMRARLTITETGDEFIVKLGHLDPLDTISGIQGRLANLGLYGGPIDNQLNPETVQAIQELQDLHDMEPTGLLDAATKSKLREKSGV